MVYISVSDGTGLCFFFNLPASITAADYFRPPHTYIPLRALAIPITIMATIYAIAAVCVIQGIRGIWKLYSVIKNKQKSQ